MRGLRQVWGCPPGSVEAAPCTVREAVNLKKLESMPATISYIADQRKVTRRTAKEQSGRGLWRIWDDSLRVANIRCPFAKIGIAAGAVSLRVFGVMMVLALDRAGSSGIGLRTSGRGVRGLHSG